MKKNLSDYVIALTVIACSAVLLGALTIALSGWRANQRGRTLKIDFRDVTGIRIHSEVRYAGAPAGQVSAIDLLTTEQRQAALPDKRSAVRVTLVLHDDLPPIPADTRVSLSSDTLLGEKFVALSAGSADGPELANGALLVGHGSGSLDTLIESIGPLVESIGPLADSLGPLVKTADEALRGVQPLLKKTGDAVDTFKDDTLPRVAKLSEGLKTTAETADQALKKIDKLVTESDGPIKTDLEQLQASLVQLKQTLATADGVLTRTDKNLAVRMQDLGVVLQNLKVVSTHAKALTQQLGEKPSRLIFSGKPQKLTPETDILHSDKPLPATRP
ncbi:MAG: phospholipid/cholesterol/gamma-HCH transport system substrate-binding protein [Chthoniobacter sp.]|jgi:virulence factor Mce-like protein|nr:phospholipid/cholesterol/gamma-HCH transport system substrate-binding protein [Chthoniobacter sp.]